ncbi:16S rRNA (cytidine(1402)-2'-O)-methyltransferase [Hydrogenovibrio sp. SC-1]|uniref:16S rRNA (cytidine(1402)-2'-O)-methyltransferase n=1 Tax=Hydrogenovibrio sp. SC-1 TaxID=2065820 RepID=UPI000C7AEDE3|nr:16S rRNA (cytidine(1402)-2'-O)-methyltransferase [Hydrogenovibrio sp. SC-1]PLA75132.1 16S rRNA (cytidine(1402)-2'-O)-methyltransferase [Hydrogenovibrio sp. SC-1]
MQNKNFKSGSDELPIAGDSNNGAEGGVLYIVATPIGNLKDITLRALDVLATVDWVAAEDTRHSKRLLQHYALHKPMVSLHEHNEFDRRHELLQKLKKGEKGALISDAGTPLISDPGYHLVNLLRQEGIRVVPIPGASAFVSALCAAGLPTDRFAFEGFLPAKKNKRLLALQALCNETRTLIFYESPHRLLDSLASFQAAFGGDQEMVVAKEITKQFEQFQSGTVSEILQYFEVHPDKVRGEFVLMVNGTLAESSEKSKSELGEKVDSAILVLLKQELPVKQIAEIVSQWQDVKKKAVYERTLQLKSD